jgi:hypothetical protein
MYGLQLLFLIVSTFIEITTNLYYSRSAMMCGTELSVHKVFNILLPIILKEVCPEVDLGLGGTRIIDIHDDSVVGPTAVFRSSH